MANVHMQKYKVTFECRVFQINGSIYLHFLLDLHFKECEREKKFLPINSGFETLPLYQFLLLAADIRALA
jgi:hypothetical protein